MLFTSATFLFLFLPFVLVTYFVFSFLSVKISFIKRIRIADVFLLIVSLLFYSWANLINVFWLIGFIIIIYLVGQLIFKFSRQVYNDNNAKKLTQSSYFLGKYFIFACSIILLLFILIRYKYSDFLNAYLTRFNIFMSPGLMLVVPLGLSFITFSAISYLADIRNGKADPGNLLDCALYLAFFPKVISGPIVLWRDFNLKNRKMIPNRERIISGMNRVCIGFAKKILLADFLGETVITITSYITLGIDTPSAWLSVLLYMLQIYYDFAGYSDIALGISWILGFDCKENFNFPYRSCSITEFWRRWHISLGTWFREYVYIPLGGNRKGKIRTLLNLGIVFILTGIWHGASLNYFYWGLINAIIVITERIIRNHHIYKKIPAFLKWTCTMFIIMMFWGLFRFPNRAIFLEWIGYLFSSGPKEPLCSLKFFLDKKVLTFTIVGILGATILGDSHVQKFRCSLMKYNCFYIFQEIILLLLFVLSTIAMISATYSPFIYFQY